MRDKKGYVHCKYLDDLEIPLQNQHTNFLGKEDKRWKRWKKQRKKYGFDDRETWNLDQMFVEWIYTRFKMYKEIGGQVIDLSFHKFDYNGKKITQEEAIDIILEACEHCLISNNDLLDNSLPEEIYILIGRVMPAMWW